MLTKALVKLRIRCIVVEAELRTKLWIRDTQVANPWPPTKAEIALLRLRLFLLQLTRCLLKRIKKMKGNRS